ncbi:MAG TPA: rhodanese-like domain-containing protein [archaeon]|nr:rhodanese-like domain-containing protein [archaeon]
MTELARTAVGSVREIDPKELASMLARSAATALDVREPWEFQRCAIPGSVLIPLGQLLGRLGELDKAKPVVCICHTGNRSLFAAKQLAKRGFTALNLAGGIDRWARELDPGMARY